MTHSLAVYLLVAGALAYCIGATLYAVWLVVIGRAFRVTSPWPERSWDGLEGTWRYRFHVWYARRFGHRFP